MTRLRRLLHDKLITLIVDLPENDGHLAKAAEGAGADALLLESLEGSDEIRAKAGIPVGINLKLNHGGGRKELKELEQFDFVNIGIEHIEKIKSTSLTRLARLSEEFSFDGLMHIKDKAEAIDAAIVPETNFPKNLTVGDLQNYISIVISAELPVIIPTQRSIKPSEVAIIWDAGAKGIILTPAVLGSNQHSFEKTIREFRAAIDDLGN